MCGRYAQTGRARRRALTFAEEMQEEISFRAAARAETWNLAPSTLSLAIRRTPTGLSGDWLSWGLRSSSELIPSPINARVETAPTRSAFRAAWQARRCIVPADGWYEWRAESGRKQPYYFRRRDDVPIFLAGLWTGETFCLLTTGADGDLAEIHHRRPLSLRDEHALSWIGAEPMSSEKAVSCAVPAAAISFYPVSSRVSNARNEGPDLIHPDTVDPKAGFLPGLWPG